MSSDWLGSLTHISLPSAVQATGIVPHTTTNCATQLENGKTMATRTDPSSSQHEFQLPAQRTNLSDIAGLAAKHCFRCSDAIWGLRVGVRVGSASLSPCKQDNIFLSLFSLSQTTLSFWGDDVFPSRLDLRLSKACRSTSLACHPPPSGHKPLEQGPSEI